jgi:pyruvate ferredoxin oxidoreductase gamma subunit
MVAAGESVGVRAPALLAGAPAHPLDDRAGAVQIRLHGRGGQGTVTAAELLSHAAFDDGLYAQAFPSFGSERMGAPVEAYCRMSRSPIRTREPVATPDVLIIQDASLLEQVDLLAGIRPGAAVLVNSERRTELLFAGREARLHGADVLTVPATLLALEYLGRPTPNSVLLGGFSAMTRLVSLDAVCSAIRQRFHGEVGEANVRAASAAFDHVVGEKQERVGASAG